MHDFVAFVESCGNISIIGTCRNLLVEAEKEEKEKEKRRKRKTKKKRRKRKRKKKREINRERKKIYQALHT